MLFCKSASYTVYVKTNNSDRIAVADTSQIIARVNTKYVPCKALTLHSLRNIKLATSSIAKAQQMPYYSSYLELLQSYKQLSEAHTHTVLLARA